MVKKYIKKPVVIDAIQWDGKHETLKYLRKIGVEVMSYRS